MEGFFKRMRGLRIKLILVFLLVGLAPLLGAMWVATETVSDMMERDIVSKLNQAVARTERYIEREGGRLTMMAYVALKDPSLRSSSLQTSRQEALKIRKSQRLDFVCLCQEKEVRGDPDVVLPRGENALPPNSGITTVIARGESIPALVGVYREGGWTGVAGKFVSVTFLEDMEELTGVEVGVYLKEGRRWGIPPNLSRSELKRLDRWLKRVTKKGAPLYDEEMVMGSREYKTVFFPLRDWRGKSLGMLIFSLSDKQTFESLMVGNRYFVVIMGLGVLLSVILGWWVAGRISEPVQRFAASADNIARGDYSLEVPLTRRKDEIGDLARAFERMRLGLKEAQRREKLASLGELSAGLAHEIRNPLGIIKNAAEGLMSRERDQTEREMLLDIIVQESKRLNKLVTDFLDFARPRPPQKVEASLKALVEEVVFSLQDEAGERGISFSLSLQEVILPLDRDQMRQVLLNLLFNALEATPSGGEVRVSLVGEKGWAFLRVEDTGTGIPPDHLDRIFDPFFTTKEKGTGLGLALVYRIVEAHGGHIQVESGRGGTRFQVGLPMA